MSRSVSPPSPFRPRLESLEGRELLASAGVEVLLLTQPLAQQTTKVNNDFTTLKNDVNNQLVPATSASAASTASTTVNGDAQKLQTDFTQLKSQTATIQRLAAATVPDRTLDRMDQVFVLLGYRTLTSALSDVNNLPGQVSSLGTLTLTHFPGITVNGALNTFGFSSLGLS